jgi:hypothetical protein
MCPRASEVCRQPCSRAITRICRPAGLSGDEIAQVIAYAVAHLGHRYGLRNVWDPARYLLPAPPVPVRFRRRMLSLGSGDPTRAICSALIAQAFQSINHPILPIINSTSLDRPDCPHGVREILKVRHHSLFAPRDFGVSPYFAVVKPSLQTGFDFHALNGETDQLPGFAPEGGAGAAIPAPSVNAR